MPADPLTGTKTICFRASDELEAMIAAVAQEQRRPNSQIIRQALADYFVAQGYIRPEGESK